MRKLILFLPMVFLVLSVASVAGFAEEGLIGHWKFDGNGNNDIFWNPNASLVGNAEFKTSGGKFGGYLYVPANGDYAKILYSSVFDLPDTFTIEFWFRQRSNQNFNQDFVYKRAGSNKYGLPTYNFHIGRWLWNQYNNGPVIAGHTAANTDFWTQPSNPNEMAHSEWHHVVFTKDIYFHAYYLDGIQIGSKNVSVYDTEYSGPAKTSPSGDVIIGDTAVDTDFDNLRIYNRALSYDEVRVNGGYPPTTTTTSTTTTTTTTIYYLNASNATNQTTTTFLGQTTTTLLSSSNQTTTTLSNQTTTTSAPVTTSTSAPITTTTLVPGQNCCPPCPPDAMCTPCFGGWPPCPTTTNPRVIIPTTLGRCTDSDGGISIYSRGVAKDIRGKLFEDVCNVNNLTEYYCDDGDALSHETACGNGCGDGACVSGLAKLLQDILDFLRSLFGF